MANLLIDIGNTAVKVSLTEGTELGKTFRYQGENVNKFIISLAEKENPEVMVISSVYNISNTDEKIFSQKCGTLLILDNAHNSILERYGLPSYLSYDRAASLIAARHLFKWTGCTVVDFGTTLTIDFIDSDGKYIGGNISLGLQTRLKAINRYSKTLPLIQMPDETRLIGTTLHESISSGIVSGIMFEIEGYLQLYPDNVVVFTGGDANYFVKKMKNSIFATCNLVFIGLALIAEEYVNNQN